MIDRQRGVYQPLIKNNPIYDLSDDQVEEEDLHSRLPLLVIIALLLVAGFAGVVWLAYNHGVASGRVGSAVIIAPPEGPLRTPPLDAGGIPVPYRGLKIYEQPVPPEQEARDSTPARGAQTSDVSIRPAAKSAPAATEANAAFSGAGNLFPAEHGTAEGTMLQIGSYETDAIAHGAWAAFKADHGGLVDGLAADIRKADLGAKGVWYRLRIGPFSDDAAATALCEKLKVQGVTCFVAAP